MQQNGEKYFLRSTYKMIDHNMNSFRKNIEHSYIRILNHINLIRTMLLCVQQL